MNILYHKRILDNLYKNHDTKFISLSMVDMDL